ncbi:MAG: putative cyclic beta-1-3 beta-1-6-glucan synthesis regulatory protein ndvD-like protein [Rhodospirillaceae bacterium]|nr:MAG: putative cyclic beta-1-3 beta-1-6-glucan synthesis regulatory protein ndvD-like protein [Rhodospirillaceae bacterium]
MKARFVAASAVGVGLYLSVMNGSVLAWSDTLQAEEGFLAVADSNSGARRKQSSPRKPEVTQTSISPFEAECAWTGKRVVSLLKREDVDTAQAFNRFYGSFGCPSVHIGKSFGCVVASESEREAIDARIDRCWADPYTRFFPPVLPKGATSPPAASPQPEQGRRPPERRP